MKTVGIYMRTESMRMDEVTRRGRGLKKQEVEDKRAGKMSRREP